MYQPHKDNSKTQLLTRRSLMQTAFAAVAAGVLGSAGSARASIGRMPFGVAVHLDPFRNDPVFREKLAQHTDLIVPMNWVKHWKRLV